jgi:hypothetical protein
MDSAKVIRAAVAFGILFSTGQLIAQARLAEKTVQPDDGIPFACRELDPDVFPSETCATLLSYLSPTDSLGSVLEDGSFLVYSKLANGTTDLKTYSVPPKLRSAITLNSVTNTLQMIEISANGDTSSIFAAMLPQGRDLWLKLFEVYCYYRPGETYTDKLNNEHKCERIANLPDGKTLEKEFSGAETFRQNYVTFALSAEVTQMANDELARKRKAEAGPVSNQNQTELMYSSKPPSSLQAPPINIGAPPLTWSSRNCSACESSVLNQGWFSDGSGLFTEAMSGKSGVVMVGLVHIDGNLVVGVSFGTEGNGDLTLNPKDAVRLETDSAPNMVLYPLPQHDPKIPKDDLSVKKEFKGKAITLRAGGSVGGYLFFPNDEAFHITVVVMLGNETFRFPFARSRSARAKFEDPDK